MTKVYKQITDNFTYEELTCPCCNRLKITNQLHQHMELLQKMRDMLGFPIIINSAYRCKAHNENVGGSVNSQHMEFATDIRPSWQDGFKQKLKTMYKVAEELDFDGIGKYDTFLHIDMRGTKARWNG